MANPAPVTLTFPNATVALARTGNTVTALVSYQAAAQTGSQALPSGFQPAAKADLTFTNTGDYSAAGTVTLQVSSVTGDAGIALSGYNSAPTVAGTFTGTWLADPIADTSGPDDHDLDEFFVHTVQVETWQGRGSLGDVFAAPVTVSCFVDDSRRLVRDKDGEQVVSEATLYTSITNTGLFVANSRVTVVGDNDSDEITPSRSSRVIRQNANDSGSLGLPDHLAVTLA